MSPGPRPARTFPGTAAGGLAAVVYTDVLQAVILTAGSCVLSYLTFERVGFSWENFRAVTSPEKLSFILPFDDPNLPWLGTLIGLPVLGFYFWCTNQFIVQRVLGARNIDHARWGALFAGLLKLPVLFIMVLPGAVAADFLPNLQTALAFLVPPVVTLFVLGLFWRRASATGAIVSLVVTHAISAVLFALYFTETLALHFTIIAGLLFLISCITFVLASLFSARPRDEQIALFTYHRGMLEGDERQPLWRDYRLHAAVLVVLTLALVITFW